MRRYALAGAGETLRCLSSCDEADEAAGLRRRYGVWCDMESVAVGQCGWPSMADTSDMAVWIPRQRALDDALARFQTEVMRDPGSLGTVVTEVLRRWAAHFAQTTHVGVRFPAAFAAALAETLALTLSDNHPHVAAGIPWDCDVLAGAQADALPKPEQCFSEWLWLGEPEPPAWAALTVGWDATDHAVVDAAGYRLTPAVRAHWQAKLSSMDP